MRLQPASTKTLPWVYRRIGSGWIKHLHLHIDLTRLIRISVPPLVTPVVCLIKNFRNPVLR